MIQAIVYKSKNDHTKRYAEILSKILGIEVYDLVVAKDRLQKGSNIIYLGWLKASFIQGYRSANKYFDIKAVGAVGCRIQTESQNNKIIENHDISKNILFYLQGGIDTNQLYGFDKFIMNFIKKGLSKKPKLNDEEKAMLEDLNNNTDYVNEVNLESISGFINKMYKNI